jgi:hypothetical protein
MPTGSCCRYVYAMLCYALSAVCGLLPVAAELCGLSRSLDPQGVMAGLDRRYFVVIVLLISNGDSALSPEVLSSTDESYHVPLLKTEGNRIVSSAALDVLVFADQMSEVNNYMYGLGRFASVQVVFWGNPTTPGHVDSIDYFMSGDVMEVDLGQTHYTEQLIRLDGQAIWYDPVNIPDEAVLFKRQKYSLQSDWVVFACPQSTFKIHPDFDLVLARCGRMYYGFTIVSEMLVIASLFPTRTCHPCQRNTESWRQCRNRGS